MAWTELTLPLSVVEISKSISVLLTTWSGNLLMFIRHIPSLFKSVCVRVFSSSYSSYHILNQLGPFMCF
jgi:hypothetical protein